MSNQGRYSKLVENTIIYGIGTFGSKILQFLIVPLYTYVLTAEEYGQIDIFVITISLLVPFVTLYVQEAVIRFLTVREMSEQQAVSNCLAIFALSIPACFCFSLLFAWSVGFTFFVPFFICLALNAFMTIFQNYLRACGKTVNFVICGLINTFVFLAMNVILLVVFRMGILGYLASMIVSYVVSSLYIIVSGRLIANFSLKAINRSILARMIKFSVPLVPNGLMWWAMSAGDKYIIAFALGADANGIFSLSLKIATLVTTVFSVFMQAWELSAIEESSSEDRLSFYENVFKSMMALLVISALVVVIATRPVFLLIIDSSYYEANFYSPLLCASSVFNCVATFAGTSYLVLNNTKRSFTTTFIGACANVILCMLSITAFGLAGVSISFVVGYALVAFLRMSDMRKEISFGVDSVRTVVSIVMIMVIAAIHLVIDGLVVDIVASLCLAVAVVNYRKELQGMWSFALERVKKKRQ